MTLSLTWTRVETSYQMDGAVYSGMRRADGMVDARHGAPVWRPGGARERGQRRWCVPSRRPGLGVRPVIRARVAFPLPTFRRPPCLHGWRAEEISTAERLRPRSAPGEMETRATPWCLRAAWPCGALAGLATGRG
jgi:hypothetical protein